MSNDDPDAGAPRVSFLIAVYNDAAFLPATLASMLGQTFADFEVVAVDDASTDGTGDILRVSGDARVRYFRNETNVGQVPSLNRGLGLCRGELVARMDGDDVCEPGRLAAQVRYMDEHPELCGCATWTTEIDPQDRVLGSVEPCPDPAYVRWSMCHTLRLYHPSMMLRRTAYEAARGYDAGYAATEDYELWARLVGGGRRLGIVPERLIRYRRRPGSITHTHCQRQRMLGLKVATRYVGQVLGRPPEERAVAAMRALLAWEPVTAAAMPQAVLGEALNLMAKVRAATLNDAGAVARAAADGEVAGQLIRQGRWLLKDAPGHAVRLGLYVSRLPGHRLTGLGLVSASARCLLGRARRRRGRPAP